MSPDEIERALKDLPAIARHVSSRDNGARQVWRFELNGKPYYLTFFARHASGARRGRALATFTNLQSLQRANVPSARAVAHLSGFSIRDVKGDALIVEGIEPSRPLDRYLNELHLRGEPACNHREILDQVVAIVQAIGAAKLRHHDLRLSAFRIDVRGKVFLIDAEPVTGGGLRTKDVLKLAASVGRFATRSDLRRAWDAFSDAPMPRTNPAQRRAWRRCVAESTSESNHFGKIDSGEWSGWFFKQAEHPRRWAPASALSVARDDWQREWPKLLSAIESGQVVGLKREQGGDVLAGEVTLGERSVSVVIKRPRHHKWHRYIKELFRGLRARQAWTKAWSLVARDVPTAWPLIVMQRRNWLGIPVQGIIVAEHVQGDLLATMNLDALAAEARRTLFHRLGRTLRLLERDGLLQYDSKTPNWVIVKDEKVGPVPVTVDVDGIRRWTPPLWPIERLLRSLRDHPQYTPEDSKWVCIGYAPRGRLVQEELDGGGKEQSRDAVPAGEP